MIFRRKAKDELEPEGNESTDSRQDGNELGELDAARPNGPWDRDETTADADDTAYVNLGGLIVRGAQDIELRLQLDEQTQVVTSAMLAGRDSGLELRAFAAPRNAGIWDEVRQDIAAEATKRGGTATEQDGEFGTELLVSVPMKAPDGRQGTQTSRIVGVEGPRWLLRGTFLGRSASDPDPDGVVETAFRHVIVVRGSVPMAPRDMIAMQMPAQPASAISPDEVAAEGESTD